MSYIDCFYRSGVGSDFIGKEADQEDILDLQVQFGLLQESYFKAKWICILNPIFCKASEPIGGADADFIIDDKLIDIKSTKKLELNQYDHCQPVCYFLLQEIDGIDEKKVKAGRKRACLDSLFRLSVDPKGCRIFSYASLFLVSFLKFLIALPIPAPNAGSLFPEKSTTSTNAIIAISPIPKPPNMMTPFYKITRVIS